MPPIDPTLIDQLKQSGTPPEEFLHAVTANLINDVANLIHLRAGRGVQKLEPAIELEDAGLGQYFDEVPQSMVQKMEEYNRTEGANWAKEVERGNCTWEEVFEDWIPQTTQGIYLALLNTSSKSLVETENALRQMSDEDSARGQPDADKLRKLRAGAACTMHALIFQAMDDNVDIDIWMSGPGEDVMDVAAEAVQKGLW